MKKRWDEPYLKKTKYNDKILLKRGTFLHTYCPHCGRSLIEDNKIVLIYIQHFPILLSGKTACFLNAFLYPEILFLLD